MTKIAAVAGKRTFTLAQARQLLPEVQRLTAEAVTCAERLAERLDELDEDHPQRERVAAELDRIVRQWTGRMAGLSVEVQGLWLVDFDNGDGYYCWRYPELNVEHYHGYDEGFAGRMKIV